MIAAGVPCPGDPLVTCGSGGGSWWPLLIGGVLFAGWIGYRFGRYGGRRCPVCGSRPATACAPGCFNDWPVES